MKPENTAKIRFDSLSANEAFARGAAAFLARYDPTVAQLADLKTAVSEAVTNCIVHAYPDRVGPITMTLSVYPGRLVKIVVADQGSGSRISRRLWSRCSLQEIPANAPVSGSP